MNLLGRVMIIQINRHQLTVPVKRIFPLNEHSSVKGKQQFTYYYKDFISQFCHLPDKVWLNKLIPSDCIKKAYDELNKLEFTDDVCDLS